LDAIIIMLPSLMTIANSLGFIFCVMNQKFFNDFMISSILLKGNLIARF
jgi:hypothetical protein